MTFLLQMIFFLKEGNLLPQQKYFGQHEPKFLSIVLFSHLICTCLGLPHTHKATIPQWVSIYMLPQGSRLHVPVDFDFISFFSIINECPKILFMLKLLEHRNCHFKIKPVVLLAQRRDGTKKEQPLCPASHALVRRTKNLNWI